MRLWLPPYQIDLEIWGGLGPDVVMSGNALVMSHRLMELWDESGLTGMHRMEQVQVKHLKVHGKVKHPIPKYFLAQVPTSRTAIDLVASEFGNEGTVCGECRLAHVKRWKRIVFEKDTWCGEDLFIARGLPSTIFVTSRVVDVFKRSNVCNATFTPAESYACDFYPWELRPE